MRAWIRDHRALAGSIAVVGAGLLVFVLVWFKPQNIFIDTRVDEALPADVSLATTTQPPEPTVTSTAPPATEAPGTTATPSTTTTAAPATTAATTTTAGPRVLSDTQLIDVGRAGTGRVVLVERPDGSLLLRFEELDVLNGPDLVVILSPSPLVDDRDAYDDGDFYAVADLKANQGNQNYDIAADVDIDEYQTVAIWCRRFNYTFNAAPIEIVG